MSTIQPTQASPNQPSASQTPRPATGDAGAFADLLAQEQAGKGVVTSSVQPFRRAAGMMTPASPLPAFMRNEWRPAPLTSEAQASLAEFRRTGLLPGQAGRIKPADGVAALSRPQPSAGALPLSAFPRPRGDNGRGIHWIPTVSQSQEVIDKYVAEAEKMGIKWVTFLNDNTDLKQNEYLVKRLVERGIEPVMRIYTDGGAPVSGDVQKLVRHYKAMGVNYYQLYNEPNLSLENQGKPPSPERYAHLYIDAARDVIAAGGLPGFGSLSPTPGLAPGSMPGDMDDLQFLRESLQHVQALGGQDVLDRSWLSVHNYGAEHLRIREYDKVVQQVLGRSLPQIGTEAGIYPGDTLSEQAATQIVADAYRYLGQREPYYFAYTYWIIANESGVGHHDPAWNHQALFRQDGRSPIVDMLRGEA